MIREATEADIGELVSMARQFHASSQYGRWCHFSGSAVTEMLEGLIASPEAAVFVTDDLSGAIGGSVAPSHVSGDLTAGEYFWWVNPDARGSGGRLLIKFENWARAQGAVHLAMIAPEDATDVHELYARRGYMPVERQFVRAL